MPDWRIAAVHSTSEAASSIITPHQQHFDVWHDRKLSPEIGHLSVRRRIFRSLRCGEGSTVFEATQCWRDLWDPTTSKRISSCNEP